MQHSRHHHSLLFLLPLALAALLLVGCNGKTIQVGGEDGVVFMDIDVPFSGIPKKGDIAGDIYRYWKYATPQEAMIDKKKVSKDGTEIDGVRYNWGGPVSFFHYEKSVIIYLGDNEKTLGQIQRTFGPKFAGS